MQVECKLLSLEVPWKDLCQDLHKIFRRFSWNLWGSFKDTCFEDLCGIFADLWRWSSKILQNISPEQWATRTQKLCDLNPTTKWIFHYLRNWKLKKKGSVRVVSSLWKVSNRTTRKLRGIIRDSTGSQWEGRENMKLAKSAWSWVKFIVYIAWFHTVRD